jgi:hypothetical protein
MDNDNKNTNKSGGTRSLSRTAPTSVTEAATVAAPAPAPAPACANQQQQPMPRIVEEAGLSSWAVEVYRRVRQDQIERKMRWLTGMAAIAGFLFGYDT